MYENNIEGLTNNKMSTNCIQQKQRMTDEENAQTAKELLESGANRVIDILTLHGLQVNVPAKGLIHAHFIVPTHLSDKGGNWHVGAIATLVDDVAATTVFSYFGKFLPAISLNITSYSTAKIHEEVEIEGKIVTKRESLVSVEVTIMKKKSGDKIALGKLWSGLAMPKGSIKTDFTPKASFPSKL